MKTICKISTLLALLFAFMSCSDDQEVYVPRSLDAQLQIACEGSDTTVTLTGLDTYVALAECDAQWVSVQRQLYESGVPTYLFKILPNEAVNQRTASVTFTSAKGDVLKYQIVQAGYVPSVTEEIFTISHEQWSQTIVLKGFTASVSEVLDLPTWIRVSSQGSTDGNPTSRIAVMENTSPSPRSATFTFVSSKSDKHSVTINQDGKLIDGTEGSNDEVSDRPAYLPRK